MAPEKKVVYVALCKYGNKMRSIIVDRPLGPGSIIFPETVGLDVNPWTVLNSVQIEYEE